MTNRPIAVVTGGAGFIGSNMVDLLLGRGDIVPSIERPLEYMSTNVQGTVQVLECARAAGVTKLVYAASSSCYGPADTPTGEDHPIQPQYPYALSKYQGEQAALHWHQVYRLPVSSIRIFNAYGIRSRTSGAYGAVFGVFLRQKLAGKPFTVVGDGTQSRDFLYASDIAEAFLAVAESADAGRISGELGWRPKVSFEGCVRRVLDDIGYWREAPLWTPDTIAEATRTWFACLGDRAG